MKTAASPIDTSILPDQARQELLDFYHFLVGKYVKRRVPSSAKEVALTGTAGALANSSLAGIWKDRDLGDSVTFARNLRDQAQKRTLS
ncbi:MAG TPA: hypothetical protein HPP76_01435 [Desulfuromonadales bacterium]|nr:hypothetical protein [Desulfuromonadales bacterium]